MTKFSKKHKKLYFYFLFFEKIWGLDFINFQSHAKSQKNWMKLLTVRWLGRETTGQTETRLSSGTPHYIPHNTINYHISQNHHTAPHYKPNRQLVLLKRLF